MGSLVVVEPQDIIFSDKQTNTNFTHRSLEIFNGLDVSENTRKEYQYRISQFLEFIQKKSIGLIGIDFDGVVTAEEVGSYKPEHGHWEEMLKRFNTKKEEVLHVAASYIHDIIPAKEQGFDAIWINRNNEQPTRQIKPDLEFSDLKPLPDTLP